MRARDIKVGQSYHYGYSGGPGDDYCMATIMAKVESGDGWSVAGCPSSGRSTHYVAMTTTLSAWGGNYIQQVQFVPSRRLTGPWDEWLLNHLDCQHERALRVDKMEEERRYLKKLQWEVKGAFDEDEWGWACHPEYILVPVEWAYSMLEDDDS